MNERITPEWLLKNGFVCNDLGDLDHCYQFHDGDGTLLITLENFGDCWTASFLDNESRWPWDLYQTDQLRNLIVAIMGKPVAAEGKRDAN